MTQRVSVSEQGQLQGALGSLRGIAMIVGPGVFSSTFAFFLTPGHSSPGAPWYLAAFCLFGAAALAWVVVPKSSKDATNNMSEEAVTG